MGVPKFYRWISERYPCLSEVVKENQIPEFDNLYLDMNGIIHPCSHPNDEDVHFRITEEQIFKAIFHYIEVLFRIIKPRKVFFMAVDGVAPRAKMNQQRGRRFRSAKDAEEREKEAVAKGEVLPTEKRFDSNCITPGTPFMVHLQEQLKYFVHQKLSKDPTWQGLRVYLSGHETPGEGEHKIMDFIRAEKADPNYDPNTRHCLYGLDADLIMLGLISHEPHFSLLREEVRFGKIATQKRPTTPEETTFHLLHLSLMREYLEIEFSSVKSKIDWFDGERIIDDWVLMGFLVGNDFIPHLPDMHISHDALPLLYKTYMEVLPSLGGYLHNHGKLNLSRFEMFLERLSQFDRDKFEENNASLGLFAGKTDIRMWESEKVKGKKQQEKERRAAKALTNQFTVLDNLDDLMGPPVMKPESKSAAFQMSQDSYDDEFDDTLEDEFKAHKTAYYADKFEVENITDNQLAEIVYNYILAIQWILDYYYNGIQSWGWYYPYHYAPYMSDLQGFSNATLKYERGQPFLPFQQLLGVLPAASKELLPIPYQRLMTLESSPIIDYYPLDFASDLNGKLQQWEAVVLIPFIDERRLLAAMDEVSKYMTDEEKSRNRHGPHLLHTCDETLNYTYPTSLPGHFPDISACKTRCIEMAKDAFHLHPSKLYHGLCTGVKFGVYFPGFPTLYHLKFSSAFKKDDIKIFQQNSRGNSVILTVETENPDVKAEDVAKELLGKTCFAEWPHLREVRVVAVADDAMRYELEDSKLQGTDSAGRPPGFMSRDMSDFDAGVWVRDIKAIKERYHKRKGVKIGASYVVVYACPLMGRRYISGVNGIITLEKQWALRPVAYAYQMLVKDIAVHDSTFQQFKTLEEVYPADAQCFMLGSPNYGCQGNVIEVENGRVRVLFTVPVEPNLSHVKNSQDRHEVQYLPAYVIGQRLGLSSLIISRLTGTIFVGRGSRASASVGPSKNFNIGLNLKFNKTSQEIQGYSKKDESGSWLYSTKVIDVIREYTAKFPEVFTYLSQRPRDDSFFEDDLFRGKSGRMKELQDFVSDLPCAKVSKVTIGLKNLDEPIVKLIEEEVEKSSRQKLKKQKMAVRPHLLYRPLHYLGNLIPDPEAEHELFDRVINVREGFSVPLGLRGVIIGIQPGSGVLDYLYEVVFDEEFPGGLKMRCTGHRGYKVPTTAIINISYGMRNEQGQQQSNKPMAVVKPQVFPQPNAQTQSRGWYSDMVTKLGSNQEQQVQRQPQQQQQQQQQVSKSKKQPQAQTPSKGAINYRAALGQDNGFKQPSDQKSNKQATAAPMTVLTRSGPKLISRSPTKEPHGRVNDKQPRHQGKDQMQQPRHQGKDQMEKEKTAVDSKVTPNSAQGQTQRINSDAKTAPKGEEVDMDAGSGRRISKETSKMQESTPVSEVDEFADMWRNLQKVAGSSGTSSPFTEDASTDRDGRNVESDDLMSPFTSGGQTPLSEEDSDRGPSIQMQLALSALPKVDGNMPVLADDNIGDDIVLEGNEDDEEVEEFQIDEEARMTPRSYAKSGTAELCRMLNIASMSGSSDSALDDLVLPHSVIIEPSKETKQYGRPLSLDQLFAGAANIQPSPGTSPVPLTPTNPVNAPTLPQGVSRGIPQGVPQPSAFHSHPQQHMSIPGHHHPGDVRAPMSPGRVGPPNVSNSNTNQPQPVHRYGELPHPNNQVPVSMSTGSPLVAGPDGFQKGTQMTVTRAQNFPAQPLGLTSIPHGAVPTSRLSSAHYLPQSNTQPSSVASQQVPAGVVVIRPGMQGVMQQPGFAMHPGGQMSADQLWQQRVVVPHHQGKQQQFGLQMQGQPLRIPGQHAMQVTPHQQPQMNQEMGVKPVMTLSQNMLHQMQYQPPLSSQQPAQQNMNTAQQNVGPSPQNVGLGPQNIGPSPQNVGLGPQNIGPSPQNVGLGPQNIGPSPQNVGLGPQNIGPAQQTIVPTQPNMNTALQNIGPAHQNTGSSNIVRLQGQPLKQITQLNRQPLMGIAPGMPSQPHGPPQHPQNFGPSRPLLRPERPPFFQGFQGQPQKAVQALMAWCQHQNLKYPMFNFQRNTITGQCRGLVQLSNGAQFVGPDCPNDDFAAEAVAQTVLTQVTNQQPRGFLQQVRPTTRPPTGINQPQGVMFHASGANPFVPLQVTKQLNTPSKSNPTSYTETSPARIVPNPQMEYPTSPGPSISVVHQMDLATMAINQSPTLRSRGIRGDSPVTGMEQTQTGVDFSQGTDHPRKQGSSTPGVKGRRGSSKAKLAINFGSKN